MKSWQVIFKDGQRGSEPIDASTERFDEAVKTGLLDGREIIGLQIIGDGTDTDHPLPIRRDGPSDIAVLRAQAGLVAPTAEREVDGGPFQFLFSSSPRSSG